MEGNDGKGEPGIPFLLARRTGPYGQLFSNWYHQTNMSENPRGYSFSVVLLNIHPLLYFLKFRGNYGSRNMLKLTLYHPCFSASKNRDNFTIRI